MIFVKILYDVTPIHKAASTSSNYYDFTIIMYNLKRKLVN